MKVEYEAFWLGEFVYVCEKHMKRLLDVGAAMGMRVGYHSYDGIEVCKNCENEKKKE